MPLKTSDHVRHALIDALNAFAGLADNPAASRALTVDGDFSFAMLDMDSLTMMEVSMRLEEALDIELDMDEMADKSTFQQLAEFLTMRIGAG